MTAFGELDFLPAGSGVPRHASGETERVLGESCVTFCYLASKVTEISPPPHSIGRRRHKSLHGFKMGRRTVPTYGGRQVGWEIDIDTAIFGKYSLPQRIGIRKCMYLDTSSKLEISVFFRLSLCFLVNRHLKDPSSMSLHWKLNHSGFVQEDTFK